MKTILQAIQRLVLQTFLKIYKGNLTKLKIWSIIILDGKILQ